MREDATLVDEEIREKLLDLGERPEVIGLAEKQ